MLEGAQKTIAELKIARQRRHSTTSTGKSTDEVQILLNNFNYFLSFCRKTNCESFYFQDEESAQMNTAVLEKQIMSMEDELSEAKLEASKLKTELVSEKSAWQIKLSEMQSQINEVCGSLYYFYCLSFFSFKCRLSENSSLVAN